MNTKLNTFITKAKNIHGDRYDYSLVEYINSKTKVNIICKIHGVFEQRCDHHLVTGGCKLCSGKASPTTDEFIERAKIVHGDKYDYSLTIYNGAFKFIILICKDHGKFTQSAKNHLDGHGCAKCSNNVRFTNDEFIKKAIEIHGNKYDYSLVNYINNSTLVKIICKEHGIFEQRPADHLYNQGCSGCVVTGFNTNTPSIIYYIKFTKDENCLYKIGITNSTAKRRLVTMAVYSGWKSTIIREFHFKNGRQAFEYEQMCHTKFKEFQYLGENIMDNGNTELFTKDVLELDVAVE